MSSYTFKNLLIVDRASADITTTRLLRNRHGQWFPDRQPFDYQSDQDKIIAFYSSAFGTGDSLCRITTEVFMPNGEIQGIVKMLCDCHDVCIISAQFRNAQECTTFLNILRDYLVKTITKAITTDRFVLHWDPALFVTTPYLENCAKEAHLLSDPVKKTHTFDGTGVDAQTSFSFSGFTPTTTVAPEQKQDICFTPKPNTFGTGFGTTSTPSNTFGTGFGTTSRPGQLGATLSGVGTRPMPFFGTNTFSGF